MIIGEAPGRNEDEMNQQFVGKAGQRLKHELHRLGIDLNKDCWRENAVACRPPENRKPDARIIRACQPRLFKQIKALNPESILLFGNVPIESVMSVYWAGDNDYALGRWTNWVIPHREPNCWISAHYHPSFLERKGEPLLDLIFRRSLSNALAKRGRPWHLPLPNEADEIEIIYRSAEACNWLRQWVHPGKTISFDYEANTLKPDYPDSEIVSCSVCVENRTTAAFPWTPDVAQIMRSILSDKRIKKIGTNIKFEQRWTRMKLHTPVRGWQWDTMLAAHVEDQSKHITSLKFQAFVRMGHPKYDTHLEHLLEIVPGTYLNRIREIPMRELLLYNGLDSRLTFQLALIQMKGLGYGRKGKN